MHYHVAYGRIICSNLSLPEMLSVPEAAPDVIIRLGKVGRCPPRIVDAEGYFHMTPGEAYFFWDTAGAFLARNGNEIIVEPLPGVPEHVIRLPLLGTVLSAVLHQQGILGLHASAIALNGGAVAFLGHRGRGKSTLAAALYARGHAIMGDDLAAVDTRDQGDPVVLPGFPQLKLMPEAAAAALGDDPAQLPRLISGYEKRARSAAAGFSPRFLPLKRLYVLDEGATLKIELLPPREALLRVLGQSYMARIFRKFLHGKEAARHFTQCAEIATKVPIFRLQRPKALTWLPATAQLLEAHNQ